MLAYFVGLLGMWLIAEAIFSLAIYTRYKKHKQSWIYDHSIRVIRLGIGIFLIIYGAIR